LAIEINSIGTIQSKSLSSGPAPSAAAAIAFFSLGFTPGHCHISSIHL